MKKLIQNAKADEFPDPQPHIQVLPKNSANEQVPVKSQYPSVVGFTQWPDWKRGAPSMTPLDDHLRLIHWQMHDLLDVELFRAPILGHFSMAILKLFCPAFLLGFIPHSLQ